MSAVAAPKPFKQHGLDIARGVPICGFTGPNGSGKTALAVQSCIADMSRGREVFSTVQINSPWGNSTPIESVSSLLKVRNATIFLDDISSIFSSRNTSSLPSEVITYLHTLRHTGSTVRWTAPEWMRCDTNLRGVTQGSVTVRPLVRRFWSDDPWPGALFVAAGLMDAASGKADSAPTRVLRRKIVRLKALASIGAYDTLADTPQLGAMLHNGVCVYCAGTRTRPKHTKERHEHLGLPWVEDDEAAASLRFELTSDA